jgi:uncharacterized protein (DUF1501 family)
MKTESSCLCPADPVETPRRHFLEHLAGLSALAFPAATFTSSLQVHAEELRKQHKGAILLWLGGGPSSIDLWDLKPGKETGGPFRPIRTSGEGEICEHLPLLAKQMRDLSIVRSMSTREADHMRARYYLHTGFQPNPTVLHPSYGSVVAHELLAQRPELEIPPFVSIDGGSVGPGFLGMTWAPFVVSSSGDIKDLQLGVPAPQLARRMQVLQALESEFIRENRGPAATDHAKVLDKTLSLMTSQQMAAFKVNDEPEAIRERYGRNAFGSGCLLARRLIEAGVPFVEVDFGGWDHHDDIFATLKDDKLPILDKAFSSLIEDLKSRGLYEHTAVICMGEFGRTPQINGGNGRDHFARAWSVVAGGAGLAGGRVIGSTNDAGTSVTTETYSANDFMATICQALGISLDISYTSLNGRPMKIANGGKVIPGLLS